MRQALYKSKNIEIFNGTYRYKCYLKCVYTHLKLEDAQREMERLERIEKEMKKCAK